MATDAFRTLASQLPSVEEKYLAEYVVNGLRDLPPEYDGHREWSRLGASFLALRERAELRPNFAALEQQGAAFGASVEKLLKALVNVQQDYADRFGLPAVEPTSSWAG